MCDVATISRLRLQTPVNYVFLRDFSSAAAHNLDLALFFYAKIHPHQQCISIRLHPNAHLYSIPEK
jgi:hypothetical protein